MRAGARVNAHSITILRDGEERVVEVTAAQVKTLVPSMHGFDCLPSYFVVGGLVFVPLTTRFLKDYFGSDWRRRCPESLLHVISRGFQDFKDEQIVVLCHLLISDVNYGYRLYAPAIVRPRPPCCPCRLLLQHAHAGARGIADSRAVGRPQPSCLLLARLVPSCLIPSRCM